MKYDFEEVNIIIPNKNIQPTWPKNLPCTNPSHNPPSHLVIPAGETREHICPGCGQKTIIKGSQARWC